MVRRYLIALVLLMLTLACQTLLPGPPMLAPEDATPTPFEPTSTRAPECTPPACDDDEVLYCPDSCPGGCGITCVTPTPSADVAKPEPTEEPEPTEAPTETPLSPDESFAPQVPVEESVTTARLAYVVDGTLWVVTTDGDLYPLTDTGRDGNPILSPDGRRVLFSHELPQTPDGMGRSELRVIDIASDATDRLLVAPEDLPGVEEGEALIDRLPYNVTWLPSADGVAFNTLLAIEHGLATNDDLWIVDVESGELTRLLEDGEGGAFAFSPDGAALVVADATTVSILNADGTDRRTLLTFDAVNTASEYAYIPQPVWSPDGSYALVAISSPEPFAAEPEPTATLWRLPREGTEAEALNELEGWFLQPSMDDGLWSPDREHIAYLAGDDGAPTTLRIADGDGSDAETYATGVTALHGWSPDGATIAYAVGGERAPEVAPYRLLLGAPGMEPVDVTPMHTTGDVLDLKWIDADTFVYVTSEAGEVVLNIGQVEGADRPLVTGVSGFDTVD